MNAYLRRFFAALQVLGGIGGVFILSSATLRLVPYWAALLQLTLLGLPLILAVRAGIDLWFDKRRGYGWSVVVQLIQVVQLEDPDFQFGYSIGGSLGVWFAASSVQPFAYFGTHVSVRWVPEPAVEGVGLNLVACFAAWQLFKHWPRLPSASPVDNQVERAPV